MKIKLEHIVGLLTFWHFCLTLIVVLPLLPPLFPPTYHELGESEHLQVLTLDNGFDLDIQAGRPWKIVSRNLNESRVYRLTVREFSAAGILGGDAVNFHGKTTHTYIYRLSEYAGLLVNEGNVTIKLWTSPYFVYDGGYYEEGWHADHEEKRQIVAELVILLLFEDEWS